ncbi:hypothetical protein CALCODRAFT_332809 [Calocera cornea HHB12733]|uniref:Uncharacterized protein n=1 Tax=Calocera cornea HHB12733 TaxID=1353952 RepID=A0A165F1F8_9BASI|nr:hypothetical protein CALCODRAFT_332809 [Calocera cornea HHB12733]
MELRVVKVEPLEDHAEDVVPDIEEQRVGATGPFREGNMAENEKEERTQRELLALKVQIQVLTKNAVGSIFGTRSLAEGAPEYQCRSQRARHGGGGACPRPRKRGVDETRS